MNIIDKIKLILKNDKRVGFRPTDIIFGRFKRARKIHEQIKYLDTTYKLHTDINFFQDHGMSLAE